MNAYNVLKRSLGRPSRGKGAVRMGCVMGMLGELQLGQEPIHASQRPREHHRLRRGSARRAAPQLVHCPAALHTSTLVRGQLCRAARADSASTWLDTVAPDTHGERGMVSDVQEGRGKADDGSRARLRDHLHRQSYRSRFRRRPIAQLDVHRQAGAALRIRPSCGTCPARASSSLAARPGKSERRDSRRSDFPGPPSSPRTHESAACTARQC